MVSLDKYRRLEAHYKNNLMRYMKEHHGEYIILDSYQLDEVVESFYKRKSEWEKEKNQRMNRAGYTFYYAEIPPRLEDILKKIRPKI